MQLRGLRGATRVERDESALIRLATGEMLRELLLQNHLTPDHVVSAIFTVTPDLSSEFPARAAREMGWSDTAMLCSVEIGVPGALERTIRVLLHVQMPATSPVSHVYLNGAEELRPDLSM